MKAIKRTIFNTGMYKYFADLGQIKTLSQWNEKDELLLNFYKDFVNEGDLCFDIGANFGNRTKIFLELGAIVIAAEPQQRCTRILKKLFGDNKNFTLVEKAIGAEEGSAEMMISYASTISSLSQNWISAVSRSKRFGYADWKEKQIVEITTLDNLIEKLGKPKFIKIDVEGYEKEVIKGLTHPINTISFEFTSELIQETISSLIYLNELGLMKTNLSIGETLKFRFEEWVSCNTLIQELSKICKVTKLNGDIYMRFLN